MKKRVMSIFGTRPEAIKLAPVVLEMQRGNNDLESVVCVTGQHREMLDQVLSWFRIRPDHDLDLMQSNQSLTEFAARALQRVGDLLSTVRPDAILVQGDTTTAMIAALAGFYNRIPVGHVEAGLRTRDPYNPFPEEVNRRIAGVLATYHFAPTQGAADALLAERVDPDNVFVVGNTVVDALRMTRSRVVDLKLGFPHHGRRLILVTAHRRESFGAPFESMCRAIREVADRNEDVDFVYPVHLNPNVREPVERSLSDHPRIHLIEPLRYEQFVRLMSDAYILLTDSGGIQEEATYLRKPTLIMRNTTERPEAVSSGTALLVGTETYDIARAAEMLLRDEALYHSMSNGKCPFGEGDSAARILHILQARLWNRTLMPFGEFPGGEYAYIGAKAAEAVAGDWYGRSNPSVR
jgi:UDP-N-acetylglucosamine 2-epimerase